MEKNQPIVIIFGPTASGKSARAMEIARQRGGVIINADAMQMYRELQVLTARPTVAEESELPHRLYGAWRGDAPGSAGIWVRAAVPVIEACWAAGQLPVIVGGTGLYIKALMQGLSPIPEIGRGAWQRGDVADAKHVSRATYHDLLRVDPTIAARLKPTDSQRIQRAYDVWTATGKPLSYWQSLPPVPPFPHATFEVIKIDLPRAEIYARCDARFLSMLEQGALEEVRRLISLPLLGGGEGWGVTEKSTHVENKNIAEDAACDSLMPTGLMPTGFNPHPNPPPRRGREQSPILRAVGVPELAAHIRGEITLETAVEKAQQATRNYAKRQITWMRGQLG